MIEKISRWSAIVCSVVALTIIATWLAFGAPPIVSVPTELATPITNFLAKFGKKSPLFSYAALFLAAVTCAAAAGLSLILLIRAAKNVAAQLLGASMGWTAFFAAYQIVAVTPPLQSYFVPESDVLRVILDATSFGLLAFATYSFLQFWLHYPRPTTAEEHAAFHTLNDQRELTASNHRIRKVFAWAIKKPIQDEAYWAKHRNLDLKITRFGLGRGFLVALSVCFAIILPFWRHDPLTTYVVDALAIIIPVFFLVGSFVWVAIKFHRILGTEQERRKVEWIYAAWMINIVAFQLMLLPTILTILLMLVAPSWIERLNLLQVLGWGFFLSIATAPLFLIVALGLSILYRGTLDPRLVLGKFTLWGVLGMLLTFGFVLIERAVALKVVQWFELPPETGLIAAGAIVAATFQPIRKHAEKWSETWVAKLMPTRLLAAGARREGAVVVTDISGYTAMSARDESSALVASALVQKVAKQVAEDHEGAFVKSTGDGAILHFHTADEAMRAITELHVAVGLGAVALKIDGLKLHSGVHWGEFVIGRDGDIYGQTVNVAARIADWAKAGEIAVSQSLAAHLEQAKVALLPGGAQQFKNVPEPIECLKFSPV